MRALVIYDADIRRDIPVCRTLSFSLSLSASSFAWIPHWLDTHPPDIIGIDPYFPAAMRQLPREPVPRHYFSFLARDLGCPNSPSVSSRASTIPFPSPARARDVAWRGAEQSEPAVEISQGTEKGTNRRCSNDKQSPMLL